MTEAMDCNAELCSQHWLSLSAAHVAAGTKFCNPRSKKTSSRPAAAAGQRVGPVPTAASMAPTSIIKPTK